MKTHRNVEFEFENRKPLPCHKIPHYCFFLSTLPEFPSLWIPTCQNPFLIYYSSLRSIGMVSRSNKPIVWYYQSMSGNIEVSVVQDPVLEPQSLCHEQCHTCQFECFVCIRLRCSDINLSRKSKPCVTTKPWVCLPFPQIFDNTQYHRFFLMLFQSYATEYPSRNLWWISTKKLLSWNQ